MYIYILFFNTGRSSPNRSWHSRPDTMPIDTKWRLKKLLLAAKVGTLTYKTLHAVQFAICSTMRGPSVRVPIWSGLDSSAYVWIERRRVKVSHAKMGLVGCCLMNNFPGGPVGLRAVVSVKQSASQFASRSDGCALALSYWAKTLLPTVALWPDVPEAYLMQSVWLKVKVSVDLSACRLLSTSISRWGIE